MTNDLNTIAYSLLAGGWSPEDREELIEEYGFTEDEIEDIIAEMERVSE